MSPSSRAMNVSSDVTQDLVASGLSLTSGKVRSCKRVVSATTASVPTCNACSAVISPSDATLASTPPLLPLPAFTANQQLGLTEPTDEALRPGTDMSRGYALPAATALLVEADVADCGGGGANGLVES